MATSPARRQDETPAETGVLVPDVHRVPGHLARRFHQICTGMLSEVTVTEDLSPVEYAVLAALDEQPGLDQRRRAERIGGDTVSAHHMLERLETRRLIDRRVDETDRRARSLALTAKGRKLRSKLQPQLVVAHGRILAPLTKPERAVLIELLTRIVEGNESYARPGHGRRKPGANRGGVGS